MRSSGPTYENCHLRKQLHVGGITFFIKSEDVACLRPGPDNAYSKFESDDFSLSSPFDINAIAPQGVDGAFSGENLSLAYTSSSSWSLYRKKDGYVIKLHPAGFDKPIWEAETNPDFSEVIVHVHIPPPLDDQSHDQYYPFRYPLDQILLMHYLGTRGGLIVHSAGMVINGKVYIFPGISGAGKSTITSCLLKNDTFHVLNDDRMIIRYQQNNFHAYGTPWPGEAGISVNTSEKLGGIFFLNKARENRIEKISPQNGFEKLMPVASIPWHHKKIVLRLFEFCEQLVQNVPAYNLYFTPSSDLGDIIYESIS